MDAARVAALGSSKTNQLGDYAHVFDRIPQWRGSVPPGYTVDFLGTLIADDFLHDVKQLSGAEYPYPRAVDGITAQARPPTLDDMERANAIVEDLRHSTISSDVIRNPDRTKNESTP